jgi:hypothetical protein
MTSTLRRSLLIASLLILAWATTSEACHRRRAYATAGGYAYASPTGYYASGDGYYPASGGYYGGGYAGYPGGYGYGGYRGYNPGGLGGRYSGLGVRPGLGFGGLGLGR